MAPMDRTDLVGRTAALLSLVEVSLGSLLHGLKVPLSGQLLSLNQSFVLTHAVKEGRELEGVRTVPWSISAIAGLLKSLSPAGKRLTPMLAIAIQGALFSIGTLIFGPTLLGICVGSILLSSWAFAQPVLITWLIWGSSATEILEYYLSLMRTVWNAGPETLGVFILGFVVLKAICALGLSAWAWRMELPKRDWIFGAITQLSTTRGVHPTQKGAVQRMGWRGAFYDMTRPIFLFSLLLTIGFVIYAAPRHDPARALLLLRPIAFGFVFFLALRVLPLDRWILRRAHRWPAFTRALREIREFEA